MKLSQQELENLIRDLFELEKKEEEEKSSLRWVTSSLRSLYEMCQRANQTIYPKGLRNPGFKRASRVVRFKTYVPEVDLNRVDHVFCSGLFVVAEGIFIDRSLMDRYFYKVLKNNSWIKDSDIEDLGLPSDIRYETMQILSNGYGFALAKNDFNSRIRSRKSWEYLEI